MSSMVALVSCPSPSRKRLSWRASGCSGASVSITAATAWSPRGPRFLVRVEAGRPVNARMRPPIRGCFARIPFARPSAVGACSRPSDPSARPGRGSGAWAGGGVRPVHSRQRPTRSSRYHAALSPAASAMEQDTHIVAAQPHNLHATPGDRQHADLTRRIVHTWLGRLVIGPRHRSSRGDPHFASVPALLAVVRPGTTEVSPSRWTGRTPSCSYDRRMVTVDDVRRVALSLPETSERPYNRRPAFRVRDRLFIRVHELPDTLFVRCGGLEERDELLAADAGEVLHHPALLGLPRPPRAARRGRPRGAHRTRHRVLAPERAPTPPHRLGRRAPPTVLIGPPDVSASPWASRSSSPTGCPCPRRSEDRQRCRGAGWPDRSASPPSGLWPCR